MHIIKDMKRGRLPWEGGIQIDTLKDEDDQMNNVLTKPLYKCLYDHKIPYKWTNANDGHLYEKKKQRKPKN